MFVCMVCVFCSIPVLVYFCVLLCAHTDTVAHTHRRETDFWIGLYLIWLPPELNRRPASLIGHRDTPFILYASFPIDLSNGSVVGCTMEPLHWGRGVCVPGVVHQWHGTDSLAKKNNVAWTCWCKFSCLLFVLMSHLFSLFTLLNPGLL